MEENKDAVNTLIRARTLFSDEDLTLQIFLLYIILHLFIIRQPKCYKKK